MAKPVKAYGKKSYYINHKEELKHKQKEYYHKHKNDEKAIEVRKEWLKIQHEKQQLSNEIYDSIVEENDEELLEFAKSMGGKYKFKNYMLKFIIPEKDYDKRFSKKKYENTPEHLEKLKQIYSKGAPQIEVEMLAKQITKQVI